MVAVLEEVGIADPPTYDRYYRCYSIIDEIQLKGLPRTKFLRRGVLQNIFVLGGKGRGNSSIML